MTSKNESSAETTMRTGRETFVPQRVAARYLGVHLNTVVRYRLRGILPYYRLGGRVYLKISDLQAFIDGSRVDAQRRGGHDRNDILKSSTSPTDDDC